MNKIKIMQVTYVLKSGAGVENLVLDLSSNFNNDNFETCVVGFKGGSLIDRLRDRDIKCFPLNKKTGFDLKFVIRLNRLIAEIKPHIIHAHTLSPNFWCLLLGKHLHGTRNISTIHTIIHQKAVYKPFYKYINLFSDRVIAVSEKVKNNYLKTINVSNSKIEVIHSGVESPKELLKSEEIKRIKKDLKINPKLKTAIIVGRLEDPKGHKYLIKAAQLLAQKGLRLNFLVVGDGYLKNHLIGMAKKYGVVDQFIFAGYRSDVSNLIQVADLAVISSVREGFSIALLEFMSFGKPLVITDVGGNREAITHGVSGIIIPPADAKSLAEGIEQVLKEPNFAGALGQQARRVYERRFTLERMLRCYDRIYRNLMMNSA